MIDHQRILVRARETWQATAPSDAEIQRGAQRVGRRLRARPRTVNRRKVFVSIGACAAFLAALAYAGSPKWTAPPAPMNAPPAPMNAPPAPMNAPPAHAPALTAPPLTPPGATQMGNETPAVIPSPASEPAPVESAPSSLASPIAPVERREPLVADKASEPSWAEVSEALSDGDEKRAQILLSDLARRGHDADNRAKAKLGLAQLEASHGNCARARVLALQVAAVRGIELKTVRRALELAAHCTQ